MFTGAGVAAALGAAAFLAAGLGVAGVAAGTAEEGVVTLSVDVFATLTMTDYYILLMQLVFKLFKAKYIICFYRSRNAPLDLRSFTKKIKFCHTNNYFTRK
jgi:hypothetical protein